MALSLPKIEAFVPLAEMRRQPSSVGQYLPHPRAKRHPLEGADHGPPAGCRGAAGERRHVQADVRGRASRGLKPAQSGVRCRPWGRVGSPGVGAFPWSRAWPELGRNEEGRAMGAWRPLVERIGFVVAVFVMAYLAARWGVRGLGRSGPATTSGMCPTAPSTTASSSSWWTPGSPAGAHRDCSVATTRSHAVRWRYSSRSSPRWCRFARGTR
jgi:hypothetical protein